VRRITTGKPQFAVRCERTAKARKRTAKSLPCVFCRGARQREHGRFLHGKVSLPFAFYKTHSEISLSCVTGRHTAKKVAHGAGRKRRGTAFAVRPPKNARQRLGLCRAPILKRTAKIGLCRAPMSKRTTKNWAL
jgi:hypothetical protein